MKTTDFAAGAATMKGIKPQHRTISNFLAFALLPLSGFATDIYLPSLPGMAPPDKEQKSSGG